MNLQKKLSITKPELITGILVFILIMGAVLGSRLSRLSSGSAFVFEEPTELILSERSSASDIQQLLESKGISVNKKEMEWAAKILGWRMVRKGRYEFNGSYSYNGLLSKMARGIQDPVSIVLLPGSTPPRLSKSVSSRLSFDSTALMSVFNDSTFLADKGFTREELFGRMLPETYLVYWTSSPKQFINKVLRHFGESFTPEMKKNAGEVGLSVDEALTLASIVEWEAKFKEEKAKISGLYWNRLNKGMRLQADPTVNFAVGERRRLLFKDYQIEHPFNTYVNSGLPPAPITNPSLETIKATIYPAEHDYLYMVANPEGGHIFTKTFREHQRESEKWRTWLKQQYRIKRQREAEELRQEQETD